MNETVELLAESGKWRSRDVEFCSGSLPALLKRVPIFEFAPYRLAADEPDNPHLQSVIRKPISPAERPIPVGVVSKSYTLIQHDKMVGAVMQALADQGINEKELRFELGMTTLSELAVFRAYLPDHFNFQGEDGHGMALRIEAVNAVDGWHKLVVMMGWFRFICLNGLVIGKSVSEVRATHSGSIDWRAISSGLAMGFEAAQAHKDELRGLEGERIHGGFEVIGKWCDGKIASVWNKTSATKVFHALLSAQDVEITDAFAPCSPTQKPVRVVGQIPGAPKPGKNLYDALQALSWVATRRAPLEERSSWQAQIPELVEELRVMMKAAQA